MTTLSAVDCNNSMALAVYQALTSRRPAPSITGSVGFIHIDVQYLPVLQRSTNYVFVAIDRARHVFVEIHAGREGALQPAPSSASPAASSAAFTPS
ncbi:hypothetical protein H8A95_21285 [Bradyrhizobium sp. Pear76]|uniref:hypothetical protein n=1 Tax=Bradyrhizobium oropedii TaxID=1571201 RepID=UPI001E44269A|nr:hypothetical protein [Bradyrhizobium oropedii]MCC8964782.1 hypothetical protein [Bradyrhizobium oropedii]